MLTATTPRNVSETIRGTEKVQMRRGVSPGSSYGALHPGARDSLGVVYQGHAVNRVFARGSATTGPPSARRAINARGTTVGGASGSSASAVAAIHVFCRSVDSSN